MTIGCAESLGIFSWFTGDGEEPGPDVRIKHGELELQILDVGVRLPFAFLGIIFGDIYRKFLNRDCK